jgi:hypothetical protein
LESLRAALDELAGADAAGLGDEDLGALLVELRGSRTVSTTRRRG